MADGAAPKSHRHATSFTPADMKRRTLAILGLAVIVGCVPLVVRSSYFLGILNFIGINAIAAMGLKKYGFEEELNEVATALFDAAVSFPYYRLPELFGGQARSAHHAPVPYPVACRPQAWAAGALPMILHAILGLRPRAPSQELLVIRPQLPHWLESVQVRALRVGRGAVDLQFRRRGAKTTVEVQRTSGGVQVLRESRWPL